MTLKYSSVNPGPQFIANYSGPEGEIYIVGVDSRLNLYSMSVPEELKLIEAAMNFTTDIRLKERLEKEYDGKYAHYTVEELCNMIENLNALLKCSDEEKKDLRSKNEEIRNENTCFKNQIKELCEENKKLREDVDFREKQNDTLLKQYLDAKEELHEYKFDTYEDVYKKIRQVKEENKNLKYENACLRQSKFYNDQTLDNITSHLKNAREENEKLRAENEKAQELIKKGIEHGYWADNNKLLAEKENLKSDLEQSRKDLDDMRRKYNDLICQHNLTTEFYRAFAKSFCKSSKENEDLRALISEGDDSYLIERLDNQRDNIKAYQQTIRTMMKRLSH